MVLKGEKTGFTPRKAPILGQKGSPTEFETQFLVVKMNLSRAGRDENRVLNQMCRIVK